MDGTILKSLFVLLYGMAGIFVVMDIIMLFVLVINKLGKKKSEGES